MTVIALRSKGWRLYDRIRVERVRVGLLLVAYKQRLRAIIATAPAWVGEKIPSASEDIGDDGAAVWISEN